MTDYTLIRRGRKAYIAWDDAVEVYCDDVSDAKFIMETLASDSHQMTFRVIGVSTTRGLRAMLCQQSVVPKEGLRCIATGSADSLKKLVEDMSPSKGKKK